MSIKKTITKLLNINGRYTCPCCNSNVKRFAPMSKSIIQDLYLVSIAPKGFETLSLDSYFCTICGANDRDRLIVSYLQKNHKRFFSVLEIAPSTPIRNNLNLAGFKYRCCDLYMPDVDDRCDIAKMTCYPDNSFDIVICSHVLEHIHEDKRAISEIARILRPNGEALILVPIPIGLEVNLYDPSIEDIETRARMYGQDDHVRMYSKSGLTDLICNSGLSIKTWSHSDDELGFEKMGLSSTSTLYVGVKRDASFQS